jgi:ArsR family transcriptional regulator
MKCNTEEKEMVTIFKALSNETRLKIIEALLDGEKCVCELLPHSKRTQSTTSIQLSILERAGILEARRDGKQVFYRIKDYRVCEILKALGHAKAKTLKRCAAKPSKNRRRKKAW